jgi:DNA-binding beta-propeller fold protein YncE
MRLWKYCVGVSGVVVALLMVSTATLPAAEPGAANYSVTQTFKIGGPGNWDYLTVDPEHKLLYVPRTTHTQVIDATTGKVIADMPGQTGNHGVALVPDAGRGFITDGRDASVFVFDIKTNEILGKLKAVADSDGIIYDPASKQVVFDSGDGGQAFFIDPNVDLKSGSIGPAIELGGKPEFLASDGQGKIFINLVDKNQVAVVDTKTSTVVTKWPTAPGGSPVGMAIDRAGHRLFVGCRNPQKLIVMSTDDGKVIADLPIGAGVDAVQFDDPFIFASCADGTLAVARETSPGKYDIVQTVKTPVGARTMGLDPSTHTLYLPTAEMQPPAANAPPTTRPARPRPKPDSFMVVVVNRGTP